MKATVYSVPGCQPCRMTKKYLTDRGVDFVEIDASVDDAAREFVLGLGHKQMPVVVTTDGDNWSGFRPDELQALVA